MKKFVSILLTLALIMALSVTAFAAENTTLTISDASREYNGYQLLNLTTSLTGKCTCAEDATHTDACYNYAYTVNEKYRDILQAQAGQTDGKNNDILEYLDSLIGDDETNDGSGTTLREVAEDIYAAILENEIEADESNLTDTASIAQGYWMFADVTNLTGQNEANSLVMVATKGQDALTIKPKVGLPTLVKKVQDINDTADSDITNNEWQDSADFDIGDSVPFQITVTMPENLAGYETYKVIIHDKLDAGLTLDASSIQVTMYASKTYADNGTGGTDVTTSFPMNTSITDGCTFELVCNDVTDITNVTKDTVFVVTYSAILTDNDYLVIGGDGNTNKAYLQFSNDPYDNTSTGKTTESVVTVFTYQLIIEKTDGSKPLNGAGFTLYKKDASGTYELVGGEITGTTTFKWTGLDDGDYKLVESTVPAGYNKWADTEFTVDATHTAKPIKLTSTFGSVTDGVIEETVINNTGTVLPETGAKGTMMLIGGGAMFVVVAAVFMVTRKKMSIYED